MPEKKLILIVDDEADIRVLLKDFFEQKKLQVLLAEDGKTGIEIAKRQVPDLVIADMLLPGEHGIDVLHFVKERLFIPVIGISGIYKENEIKKGIIGYEIDGFFEKPLNLEMLWKKISQILNE